MASAPQLQEEQDQLKQTQKPQPVPTAEEEALKRNTDCVYFLASPLTCKKGSECEYRHSEYARVNPRDCYYWLNGNCLNPKCGFRHPPLDGLLGTQVATPTGASLSSVHPTVPVAAHVPYGSAATTFNSAVAPPSSSKPAVPCIFYQKGYCLKGDRCAFLHGPVPSSNKSQQATAANPATGPPSSKMIPGASEKYSQQQNFPPANIMKMVGVLHDPKPAPKVETVFPRNGFGFKQYAPQTGLSYEETPRYNKTSYVPPVVNGSSVVHTNISHQTHASVKDTDDHLRESSPGFDVLVDDELGDAEYYHGENQFGGQEGRNGNEYDVDREMFREKRGYDSYDRMQGQYDWDQRRSSSERIPLGSGHTDRRGYSKDESPDRIGESDLRYRLSKHRRVDGLKSVVTHDHASEKHVGERGYRSSSRRGSLQQEGSLSSRLRGRIKLPERSERDAEGGQSRGRSPGRPQISHSGRLRDRIKGRVEDEFNNKEDGSIRDRPSLRKEAFDDSSSSFSGPKRLAELKDVNIADNENHILRKRKALAGNHQSTDDLSFAGPMPLSEILKRKRQAKTEAPENGFSSLNQENKNQSITKNTVLSQTSNDETNRSEESKPVTAEAVHVEGKTEDSSQPPIISDHEAEDGMIIDEGIEEHELEGEEQQGEDGEEYYYEQGEEGDYTYEDAENLGPEEEYLDDEDGDDFAKKIGVVSS